MSHTTVSRALNNSPLISEETRKRIQELARAMDYVPNKSAKSLVNVRSYNLGIFFTSLVKATSSDFIYSVMQSVNDSVPELYTVIYNGIDKLSASYRITGANYDGILLISQNSEDDRWIGQICEAGVPLVVMHRELKALAGNLNVTRCGLGSGWLLSAEAAAWVQLGWRKVLSGLPFGCLPGHIYGRSVYAALQRQLPGSLIVGVDYDASIREITVQSRIRMLIDSELE